MKRVFRQSRQKGVTLVIPRSVYLVRHGESRGDVDETVHESVPDHLIPITERGRHQAEEAGAWLASHCEAPLWVWTSTHLRTLQTLEGLQRGGLGPAIVRHTPLLREQEWSGSLDTADVQQRREQFQKVVGKFHLRLPGGESRADVFLRVTAWMDEAWRAFRDERKRIGSVVVVTHGVALLMIRGRWMHWDLVRMETEGKPGNCSVYELAHIPDFEDRWADRGEVFAPQV